jgi:hypothetical protein
MAFQNECGAEVKGECICVVDDKEENAESSSMHESCLEINGGRLVDVAVVQVRENLLSAKCLSGANGGDNLFSERTTLRDVLEREPVRENW